MAIFTDDFKLSGLTLRAVMYALPLLNIDTEENYDIQCQSITGEEKITVELIDEDGVFVQSALVNPITGNVVIM